MEREPNGEGGERIVVPDDAPDVETVEPSEGDTDGADVHDEPDSDDRRDDDAGEPGE